MQPPPTDVPDFPVPLSAETVEVVRAAAWIGESIQDDVFVSYTTLLLGLLFARLSAKQDWQVEARRALRVAEMLKGKGELSRSAIDRIAREVAASPERGWPSGRPMLSASATLVLTSAASLHARRTGSTTPAEPADIMASYLFDIPRAHVTQAQVWGLSGEEGRRVAALLPGSTPPDSTASPAPDQTASSPTSTDLPGYDAPASAILRLAFVLAGRRKEARRALLRSSGLMVAIAESQRLLPPGDAELAKMLRGMLDHDGGYAAVRDAAFDMPADLAAAVAAAGDSFPPLSNNAQPILDDARLIAGRTSGNAPVGARHLLAALISMPDGTDRASDARIRLTEAGADIDVLREAMARIIRDRHPRDDHAAWRSLLIGSSLPMIATARPDVIPADPRGDDTLDIRRYADALGALMAAREQRPPLSIAVFGPWGSGKSFFMAMIRAAVREFEQAGRDAAARKQPTPFLGRIVQIEFNAWHYAEGNLWASLVHAILVALERELKPKDPATAPFELMLNQLKLREAEKIEAEQRLQAAERRLVEAQAAMRQADQQLASRRASEGNLPSAADVLRAVQQEALAQLGPPEGQASPEAWIRSVGDSVAKAATYLGRPELADQVPALTKAATGAATTTAALQTQLGAVRELLDEAHSSAARGMGQLGWLANARIRKDRLILGVLLTLIALVLLVGLAQELEARGAEIAATMTTVVTLLGTATTALGAALAWAKRHMADASRAFALLGSIRERVEARQAQRLSEHEAELLAARRATSEAEAEAARRRAEFQAAQAAVDKAQEELKQSVSAERLKRFVAQRLAEGDYQRHLGLVHTIRTDLERLQEILEQVHPQESAVQAQAPVERIVLYIDDLDRCPPARVVEVLEAVHLLLAFKLFVAVVGVDVRWVAQALHERYPKQLGEGPGIASPIDYLEKVFQVPFWLPPMDAAAGRRLLEGAVGTDGPSAASDTSGGGASTTHAKAGQATPDKPLDEPADAAGPEEEEATPAQAAAKAEIPEPQAVAEALVLGPTERDRLLDMAAAIGASPRRAKRFANLYRLLKASLSPAERRGFALEGGEAGSYDAALILLALSTGAPRATGALIARLQATPASDSLAALDAALEAAPPEEAAAVGAARALCHAVADQQRLASDLHFWSSRVTRFNFDGRPPPARRSAAPSAPEPPARKSPAPRRKPKPAAA
ncbi:hypothetical protein DFH01_15745 [Falsiroseomonas bella]|uniref:KAP NTPase domain-containing protein n=1 Tax=Falsiroseomonas bella TaxID=2184016 RepID=A0A317FCM2_9PROT|nr:P-loop NTPase fold protein [Falsiroseomonas bella]PWS36595.1 hypothetical protein DFH01_15745 [Falsiroseomonas bella]